MKYKFILSIFILRDQFSNASIPYMYLYIAKHLPFRRCEQVPDIVVRDENVKKLKRDYIRAK